MNPINERDGYMLANALIDVWSGRKRRFHYATVPLEDVAWAAHITTEPDAYVADDAATQAVRELLAKGYRWVRTDRDWAVFEKEIIGGRQ
jgi:hypothetical protein